MPEDLPESDREELDLYRSILKEKAANKSSWSNRLAEYLGLFIGLSAVVFALYLCWNYALVVVFPVVPNVTFLQMAGLWYLTSVFLKRS